MVNATLLQRVIDASNDSIVVAEQEGEDNQLTYCIGIQKNVTAQVQAQAQATRGGGGEPAGRGGPING